jgi:hypothetical protein
MSKAVKTQTRPSKKTPTERTRYPWSEWSKDSKPRTYSQGQHFFVDTEAFAVAAYAYAKRHKITLRIQRPGDGKIILQFNYNPKVPQRDAPVVKGYSK